MLLFSVKVLLSTAFLFPSARLRLSGDFHCCSSSSDKEKKNAYKSFPCAEVEEVFEEGLKELRKPLKKNRRRRRKKNEKGTSRKWKWLPEMVNDVDHEG